jgi:hypothetical protein
MAEMFLDLMTITIDQKPVFSESDFECWCRYFGDLLEKSPTLRYWYAETRDWYEPHVRELLDHLAAGRFPAAPRMAAGIPLQSRRFSRRRPDHGD